MSNEKEQCQNCDHFKEEVSSGLDGECLLSTTDNDMMMSTARSYPEEPVLDVSLTFGCNQWTRNIS